MLDANEQANATPAANPKPSVFLSPAFPTPSAFLPSVFSRPSQLRLQARLHGLEDATRQALRRQAIRAVLRWPCMRSVSRAMLRWRLAAVSKRFEYTVSIRLEAAYQRADAEMSSRRSQLATRLREREAQAELSQRSLGEELAVARREREAAAAAAAAEAERRERLEQELARAREMLAQEAARREASDAELAAARALLDEQQRERDFLARALHDERRCAAVRATEARSLDRAASDCTALSRELDSLGGLAFELRFDVSHALAGS